MLLMKESVLSFEEKTQPFNLPASTKTLLRLTCFYYF